MFFIKQQQSASCTQLLITHQTRKASSLSCRQEAAFQAKIQPVWVLLDQHSDSATLTLRMNLLTTHLPTQGCTLIMDPVLHLFNRLLSPGATGSALFRKTPNTATGSVGVVTYDLMNTDTNLTAEKIAVMFSAPYNYGLYSNLYAVGVFDESTKCDYAFYHQMYYDEPTTFSRQDADGSWLTYKGGNITIQATMSNSYQPVIKVQVSQTGNE
ncbi:hypothetical protein CgunFtcFv8_006038 [Champsocephalus gunnari]|uniref:Uncharacterized protein n=1 Tax=Champsocephalus gunnari TaxID=52237 RepID=A0AAN8GYW9_CHAGU|nr:hypothetical protein CgunFtcFv8_006038 [Champsocephalus gunnari]